MGHVDRNSVHRAPALLSWQEALAIIESCNERGVPRPFAIAFYTCDEERKTGGELIRYEKAIWHVAGGRVQKTETFERVSKKSPKPIRPATRWYRLIRGFDTDQPRRVFLHLISEINGQPVR